MIVFKPKLVLLILSVFLLLYTSGFAYTVNSPDGVTLTQGEYNDSFSLDYIFKVGKDPSDALVDTPIGSYRYDGKDITTANPDDLADPAYTYGAQGVDLLSKSYELTDSVGVFPDNDGGQYNPNIGIDEAGLLNGEGNIFDPGAFITTNDLQDIDGVGGKNDPGWVHLGKYEYDEKQLVYSDLGPLPYGQTTPWGADTIHIGDLLSLNLVFESGTTGFWELAADPTYRDFVVDLLGEASFDQLAFIVKAGNGNSDGGFIVYDFNFNTIFEEEANPLLNLDGTYVLGGSFDVTDDFDGKTISHISVLARDPSDVSTVVPEPATMLFFGFGLLGIAGVCRKRIEAS